MAKHAAAMCSGRAARSVVHWQLPSSNALGSACKRVHDPRKGWKSRT